MLSLLMLGTVGYAGYRLYAAGEAHVQAQWDATKATQAQAAVDQAVSARATEQSQSTAFNAIEQTYLGSTPYANALAPSTAAAVSSGALRVRGCTAQAAGPGGGAVSAATARSRAADAAATQALADRAATAIAAVRVGDAADAREHELDQKVIALEAALQAERQPATQP